MMGGVGGGTHPVQIKICGLRDPAQAAACAELGADAVGVVFYPRSPRNVTPQTAAQIRAALGGAAALVGVFVDCPPDQVLRVAEAAGLDYAQLHGRESAADVRYVMTRGLRVIKVLKDADFSAAAADYECGRFLLELGRGVLPGGNGQGWNWAAAAGFAAHHPFLLAGGLGAGNVAEAIAAAAPTGVDASSALEVEPGVKDMDKVAEFIRAVRACGCAGGGERVFI